MTENPVIRFDPIGVQMYGWVRRRYLMRSEHKRAARYLRERSEQDRRAWTYTEWQEALRATTSQADRVTPLDPLGIMKWDGKDVEREAARAQERDKQRSATLDAGL